MKRCGHACLCTTDTTTFELQGGWHPAAAVRCSSRGISRRRSDVLYRAMRSDSEFLINIASSCRSCCSCISMIGTLIHIVHIYNCDSFILDNNGTLSYSRAQGEKTRDSVDLRKCSVGRSKKRRHLVIDSGDRVPWHCKALSDKDFER